MKHTRQLSTILPRCGAWLGALLVSAATVHASGPAGITVTFNVDMSAQINASPATFVPGTDTISVSGTFNGWGQTALTQVGSSTVYTATVVDTDDTGGSQLRWKAVNSDSAFSGSGGYETTADYHNRTILLPTSGSLTVPTVFYNDAGPGVSPAINVTFNVDMGVQEQLGNWAPANGITVQGNWNGWAGNTMSQVGSSTVYSVTIPIANSPNAADDYKFVVPSGYLNTINGGYENPSQANQDDGGNRWFYTSSTFNTLPTVFYGDQIANAEEYLSGTVNVTFTVDMTDAVGTDGYVFGEDDSIGGGNDVVCINGVYGGQSPSWAGWTQDGSVPNDQPFFYGPLAGLTLTESEVNPNLWSITVPLNAGTYDDVTYKYSINGWDDEAGFNDNHTRWIRNTISGNWTMPSDVFGSQGTSTSAETSFGNLTISNNGSGATISWLGHNGVELQSAPSPTGPWTKITSTDGTVLGVSDPSGMVSYPISTSGTAQYYELVLPTTP
jgi:hypothetical protein